MRKKVALLGVFLALALICSYIESLIPFYFGVPGMKLGLTNIVVVLLLYFYGTKEALAVSFMRILLAGFMFGNAFSILYSLAGGLCHGTFKKDRLVSYDRRQYLWRDNP